MARKKREDEPDNHERWMVSYADFITLLFAFFVVMYAISSVNEGKYRELTHSIGIAFGFRAVPALTINENAPVALAPPAITRPLKKKPASSVEIRKERERMKVIGRDLIKVLSPLIDEGKVKVIQSARGVNVEISASVLFAPADARLSKPSETVLKAVAQILKDEPNDIQVAGFTDNTPIRSAQFPSNWELSSARASSVVRLFAEQGIAAERMAAIGNSSNNPIDDNATPEGRARNRRVSLMVLSTIPDEAVEIPVDISGNSEKAGSQP